MYKLNKFYISILITIIICALLPIVCFYFFINSYVKSYMESQIIDTNTRLLNQTNDAMEIVIGHINDSYKQLMNNHSIREYENYTYKLIYENAQPEDENVNPVLLSDYLTKKTEFMEDIQMFKHSNEFIHSVYYYDKSSNLVITDEQFMYQLNEFYDTSWLDDMNNITANVHLTGKRDAIKKNGELQGVLTLIYRSLNFKNAYIINIDLNYIYDQIIQKLDTNKNNAFFIISEDGDIIVKNEKETFFNQYGDLNDAQSIRAISEKDIIIINSFSHEYKWEIVNMINMDELYKETNAFINVCLILSIAIALFIILVSFFSSKQLYSPIKKLIKLVNGSNPVRMGHSEKRVGEIEYLEKTFKKTLIEKEELKKKLNESLVIYREKFISSLLNGFSDNIQEIRERINFFEIDLMTENLFVAVIAIDAFEEKVFDMKNISIIQLQVKEIIKREFLNCYQGIASIEGTQIVIIFNHIGNIMEVLEHMKTVKNEIYNTIAFTTTIGIGRHCTNIHELNRSYNEALEALKYSINVGYNKITYFEDIANVEFFSLAYLKPRMRVLYHYVKSGEAELALKIYGEIVHEMKKNKEKMQYLTIQQFFIQFLAGMIETIYSIDIEPNQIFQNDIDIYGQLENCNTLGKKIDWTKYIIEHVAGYVKTNLHNSGSKYIDAMVKLIQKNGVSELSLNTLADELNISTAYLSRDIKKETGKGFIEHLKEFRIKESKELLKEGKMSINEIAEKVGYTNTYSFITLFKQFTGITPGEYKRVIKESESGSA